MRVMGRFIFRGAVLVFLATNANAQGQAEYSELQPDCKQIEATKGLSDKTGGLFGAATAKLEKKLWELDPFERGKKIEEAAAKVLRKSGYTHLTGDPLTPPADNFPVIDFFFGDTGTAISMKSMDPNLFSDKSSLLNQIRVYIEKLAGFCNPS